MPNVVLEALSCGRNVVATDVGGVGEIIDDRNGILIQPGDSAALAAALERSLEISWNRAAIAESCSYSWAQVAEKTLEICTSVVNRAQRSPALALHSLSDSR